MKKGKSEKAYYERLNELANSKKPIQKESNRGLGTLENFKRTADGVAYGIIKENHNYYIKKGGLKESPDVSDFVFIGGLSNIKDYQYSSLGEAEKQRNMMFKTINETFRLNDGNSKLINEDVDEGAKEEIDQAEEKIGALDVATDAANAAPPAPPAGEFGDEGPAVPDKTVPIPDDGEGDPMGDIPTDGGMGDDADPMGGASIGDENPEMGTDAPPEGGDGIDDMPADGGDTGEVEDDEIKEYIGKAGQKVMAIDLEVDKIEAYIKEFLGYFKKKLATKLDPKQRQELADKTLINVEKEEGESEADLEASGVADDGGMPQIGGADTQLGMAAEGECSECGGFGSYAESRGYDMESFQECGDDEKSNVISGYAGAHGEGQNDGDLNLVALLVTPEILDSLKNDYGHDEYADKLNSFGKEMSEGKGVTNIAELWNPKGIPADGVGVQDTMPQDVIKEEDEFGTEEPEGEEPEGAEDEVTAIDVPEEPEEETPAIFAPAADNLGADVAKPEGAPIEIDGDSGSEGEAKVEINADTVNLTVNEGLKMDFPTDSAEDKLREYIRLRLEGKTGKKKLNINESAKSPTLKKLDALIDKQFNLFESTVKK